jgi:hypothetical protein
MERTYEMLLTAIVVIVCIASMKLAHDTTLEMERMTQQVQMMFVKS